MNAWLPQASSLLPDSEVPVASRSVRPVGDGLLSEGNSPYLRPDAGAPNPHLCERWTAQPSRAGSAADRLYPRGCDPLLVQELSCVGVTLARWYPRPDESFPHPGVSPDGVPEGTPDPIQHLWDRIGLDVATSRRLGRRDMSSSLW
jgi:hypothetical protein